MSTPTDGGDVLVRHGDFTPVSTSVLRQAFIGLLIAATSGSFGFGASQLVVVSDVKLQGAQLANIEKEFGEERRRTDSRLTNVAHLMEANAKLNTELVNLVKVQNELLARERAGR